MSNADESLGVTNPVFVDDTQDEGKTNKIIQSETEKKDGGHKNGDVVVDIDTGVFRNGSLKKPKNHDEQRISRIEEVTIKVGAPDSETIVVCIN